MHITGNLQGTARILADLDRIQNEVRKRSQELVADTVLYGERKVVEKIAEYKAIQTGRLIGSIVSAFGLRAGFGRQSVTGRRGRVIVNPHSPSDTASFISDDGLSGAVGTNVEYAIPVHEGYRRVLKRKVTPSAYGRVSRGEAKRGTFAKLVRPGEGRGRGKPTKAQEQLLISTATYGKLASDIATREERIVLDVPGRPFLADVVPDIEDHFFSLGEELLGPLGFQITR